MYSPLAEIVPTVILPPAAPSTDQLTAISDGSVEVIENCCVPPVPTRAFAGEMLMPAGTVTVALALAALLTTLVAVIM